MSAPAPDDPLIGQVIDDRYRLRRVLGRGGMGVVYEAEATRLGKRLCAVKVLLPEFTRHETAMARFTREAQVAARVKHPNVVEIFDTGTTPDGLGFIAMELLRGEGLDAMLRREVALPWPRAQRVILQICRALAAAHAQGIVHRDMKPANCFRCERDDEDDLFIKVLDFGIAKLTDPDGSDDLGRLTATNAVIGTYSYMAFEQIRGEEVDHRADVWATGVILYQLLTGQLPFSGNNLGQLWRAISERDPTPMGQLAPDAGIPAALEPIVRQALARSLADRYPSIDAFARAVASVQADGSVRSPADRFAVATTVAADASRRSRRAAPVRGDDPTDLMLERAADTDESPASATIAPSTSPDLHAGLAPPPDAALQTAGAGRPALPSPAAREPAPPRRGPRRAILLAALALQVAALATLWLLSRRTDESATATSSGQALEPPPAALEPAPPPELRPPPPQPLTAPGPPPVTLSADEPADEPAASPGKTSPPAPGKPAPRKADEGFAARASKSLKRLADSPRLRACFTTYKLLDPMDVDVTIAATGAAQVAVPPLKRGSGLALCIEREFKAWTFPTGGPGDGDYVSKKFTLNRR